MMEYNCSLSLSEAENETLYAKNPELEEMLSLELGVSQNIAFHAAPAARKSAFFIPDSHFIWPH